MKKDVTIKKKLKWKDVTAKKIFKIPPFKAKQCPPTPHTCEGKWKRKIYCIMQPQLTLRSFRVFTFQWVSLILRESEHNFYTPLAHRLWRKKKQKKQRNWKRKLAGGLREGSEKRTHTRVEMCIAVTGFELLPGLSFAAVSDSQEFSVVLGVGRLVVAAG